MRVNKRLATALTAGATLLALPPLVTGASAASSPDVTSAAPADGAVASSAPPSQVSVSFSEPVQDPAAPVSPSTISVTRDGAPFACTPGITGAGPLSQDTLTCTPSSPSDFVDGDYVVSYDAQPVDPTDSDASGTVSFTVSVSDPALVSSSPASAAIVQSPASVSATYDHVLVSGTTIRVRNNKGNTASASAAGFSDDSRTVSANPSAALPEAGSPYSVDVHAVTVGSHSTDSHWTFNVDNTAPATPALVLPEVINIGNASAAPVHGTADPGSIVHVSATDGSDSSPTATATVDGDGNWSAALDASALTDGTATITATAADAAGNVSDASHATLSKDTVSPAAPSATVDPNPINDQHKTAVNVSGNADPSIGISISVSDASDSVGPFVTTTNGDGDYSYGPIDVSGLADGTLTASVTATDGAGNTTTASSTATKDVAAPGAATVSLESPINGDTAGNRTVSGTADADTTQVAVSVTDGSHVVTEPTVAPDVDGHYSVGLDLTGLADGPLTVHALSTDAAGNTVDATTSATKDTAAPAAPAFTAPAYVNAANASSYSQSGTGEPGSSVTFSVSDGTASVDATVTVDAHGDWTVDGMDIGALGDGPITMTATAVDVAGNASDPTSGTSALDTVAPGAPGSVAVVDAPITSGSATVTGSGDNGDSVSVDVTSDGGSGTASATGGASDGGWSVPVDVSSLADGTLTVTVTETDAAGNVGGTTVVHAYKDTTALAAVATTPADGSFGKNVTELSATYDEQIDLGRSSVTLTDSTGTPLATTDPVLSDDQRTIRVQAVDDQLAEDAYTLTVSVHDKTTESATTVVHFTLDRTPASAPSVGSLGSATATNVTTVPVSGTAPEPNGSLTVSVTDGAATVTKTVALGESTSWATQVDLSSLADGPITATATEADRAGNVSSVSAPISSTKDTVVPAAPAPSLPNVTNANESSVSVSGTGESGDTVNVAVSDGTHDAVTAHAQVADGTWSATLDLSTLSEGTLTVSATQTDGVGNVSDVGTATATKDLSDHSNLTSAVSTSAILVGNSTTLSGALTDTTNTGNIAGARVDIYGQITPSRTYALLASATTGQNGAYSYTVKLARNTMLQARYAGDSNHDSVIGPARWVTVAPKVTVTAPANRATVTANRSVTFTGSVTPNMTGATVALYETHATGNPTLLVSGVVSGSGKFSLKRTSGFKAGSHTVRIVVSATTTNATGFTPIMTLRAK